MKTLAPKVSVALAIFTASCGAAIAIANAAGKLKDLSWAIVPLFVIAGAALIFAVVTIAIHSRTPAPPDSPPPLPPPQSITQTQENKQTVNQTVNVYPGQSAETELSEREKRVLANMRRNQKPDQSQTPSSVDGIAKDESLSVEEAGLIFKKLEDKGLVWKADVQGRSSKGDPPPSDGHFWFLS